MIPKTRWATTIDGAGIAYQDFGEGPVTLLVIHGWISHLEVYWEQPCFARFMRRLSRNMRVLHFDKRGTGMSERFARPPDLETRMDDVQAVMDAPGVERTAPFAYRLASFKPIGSRTLRLLIRVPSPSGPARGSLLAGQFPHHRPSEPGLAI